MRAAPESFDSNVALTCLELFKEELGVCSDQ